MFVLKAYIYILESNLFLQYGWLVGLFVLNGCFKRL